MMESQPVENDRHDGDKIVPGTRYTSLRDYSVWGRLRLAGMGHRTLALATVTLAAAAAAAYAVAHFSLASRDDAVTLAVAQIAVIGACLIVQAFVAIARHNTLARGDRDAARAPLELEQGTVDEGADA